MAAGNIADRHAWLHRLGNDASFSSWKRRRRATPVITSTFENVSDIGVCLGLSLGPPAIAGVRSKRGAVQLAINDIFNPNFLEIEAIL